MPNRTAKFVSFVFINILAGLPLATVARGETAAPDNCLSAPKGETPAGSHWRYHIDHVNKRNCWYLRQEGGRPSQALPQSATAAPSPPAKPSVADARAEFRPQDNTVADPPAPAAAASDTSAGSGASASSPSSASIWDAAPAVTTRWPAAPASAAPAASTVPNAASATATPAPANDAPQTPADSAQTVAPPPPANSSASIEPETIRTLIAGSLGALAFAAAAALIARRRSLGRHLRRRMAQSAQGPIWETTDDDRIVVSDRPYPDHRDYRPRFARGAGAAPPSAIRKPESARRAPRYAQR